MIQLLILLSIALGAYSQTLYALSGNNLVYTFVNRAAATPSTTFTITGLQGGSSETLLSIATYPTNAGNYLYGLSTANKIYYLNNTQATYISTLSCNPSGGSNPSLSMDFNPTNGLLTILTLINAGGTNLYQANATTGACTSENAVTLSGGATPKPAGVAYYLNGGSATVYTIETLNNNLDTFNATSGGNLNTVGSVGAQSLSGVGGFAYSYANSVAIATLYNTTTTSSNIYSINLGSGNAVLTGDLAVAANLLGVSVVNNGNFPTNGLTTNPAPGFGGSTTTSTTTSATSTSTTTSAPATSNRNSAGQVVASVGVLAALLFSL